LLALRSSKCDLWRRFVVPNVTSGGANKTNAPSNSGANSALNKINFLANKMIFVYQNKAIQN